MTPADTISEPELIPVPPRATTPGEALAALGYFAAYAAYSFRGPESELMHYPTLVMGPLLLVWLLRMRSRTGRGPSAILASFGLRPGNLARGVGWAALAGIALGGFQLTMSRSAADAWALVASGKALLLFPIAAGFGILTAGVTEEFFFRGFLQTRMEDLLRSRLAAVLLVSVLFGLYHVPYAYLSPNWPSAGDLAAAFRLGMVDGTLGGLILGGAYVLWRRNLVACIVLHGLIDAVPIMTMIKFSGPGGGS